MATDCKRCQVLRCLLTETRNELDRALQSGISDSTFDRLERLLSQSDLMLVLWYEYHDWHEHNGYSL